MILTRFVRSVGNIFKNQWKAITYFVKKIYVTCYKVKLGDQDKPRTPHIVYKPYVQSLERWPDGTLKSLRLGVPMVWRELKTIVMSATSAWWT